MFRRLCYFSPSFVPGNDLLQLQIHILLFILLEAYTGWEQVTQLLALTRNRSPQCHKHHSSHGVPEPHGAAEVGRQVSDDGSEEANDADGD